MESWLQPLFDAEAIRAVDRWAIEEQGVPSPQLMEAAATALAEAVVGLSPQGPVRVLCGKGNNGGDGRIAARLVAEKGFEVEVAEVFGDDFPADLDAWLAESGAVVDAIFGTGFSGAPREPAAAAIEAINRCGAPVVACDIASGVDASSGEIAGAAVEADLTVSFHAAKLGQRIAPGKWHTGELRVVPIGIPPGASGTSACRVRLTYVGASKGTSGPRPEMAPVPKTVARPPEPSQLIPAKSRVSPIPPVVPSNGRAPEVGRRGPSRRRPAKVAEDLGPPAGLQAPSPPSR